MAQHNKMGSDGEHAACEFLIARGYTIRETNWRLGHLEIDIVAQEAASCLHIVEVKTRACDDLFNAANGYIELHNLTIDVQFDVMILVGTAPDFEIHYIPDAFQPPLRSLGR